MVILLRRPRSLVLGRLAGPVVLDHYSGLLHRRSDDELDTDNSFASDTDSLGPRRGALAETLEGQVGFASDGLLTGGGRGALASAG